MDDYEQDLTDEAAELSVKIGKLTHFLRENRAFKLMPDDERTLLRMQHTAMVAYRDILDQRIVALQEPANGQ